MKKTTNFNIALDVFPRFSREKINFLQRDMEEFTRYGYNPEMVDVLDEQIRNFEEFPTDAEYAGDVMIATEKKNALAKKIRQKIRAVMLRVQNIYGQHSAYYKKFGAAALSQLSTEQLLCAARRVPRVAAMYLAELQKEGLTHAHITELRALSTDFFDAMEAQRDAIADREIGTMLRVNTANELYVGISRICETGKGIWKDVNAAKYKAYIIYDTPKAEEEVTNTEREA